MSKFLRISTVVLLSLFLIANNGQKVYAQDVSVSYQTFYDDLAPYGQWESDPQYGNIWVPNEDGDFVPYFTNGYWLMTDDGNTWVSNDPWGWICYHYGRWINDPYNGWVWIPGYDWAPAWVSWRFGGGYCGWAPLAPGVDIDAPYNCPDNWWIFVRPRYMYQPDFFHHWRGTANNKNLVVQTSFVNNVIVDNHTQVRYNYGPHADVIQKVTNQPVSVYHLSQAANPGAPVAAANTLSLYHPTVNSATVAAARATNAIPAPMPITTPKASKIIATSPQSAFRPQVPQLSPGNPGAPPIANTVHQRQAANNTHGSTHYSQPNTGKHQNYQSQAHTQPQRQNRPAQQQASRAQPQSSQPVFRPQPQQQCRSQVQPQARQPQQQARPAPVQRAEPTQEGRR